MASDKNATKTFQPPEPPKRDAQGRLLPGSTLGGPRPGRPPTPDRAAEYRDILFGRCTPERWLKIVDKAIERAADEGDRYAREWLGRYILGDPPKNVAVTVDSRSQALAFDIGAFLSQPWGREMARAALRGSGGDPATLEAPISSAAIASPHSSPAAPAAPGPRQ